MQSDFKVFHAGYYYNVGEIVCIITGEKKEEMIYTEWYYIIRNKKFSKKKGFKIKSVFFNTIQDFWNRETITNLKDAIFYDEIFPVLQEMKNPNPLSFVEEIKLKDADESWLFLLKTENEDFIDYVNKYTSCSKLKDFITILKSIKIERTPIDQD